MTIETKQFNFAAVSTGITLFVYLLGTSYALVAHMISFAEFIAAVGLPLGGMTGWTVKTVSLPKEEKLLS